MATRENTAPRVIIHGGAGNVTRENLPPASYAAYKHSLLQYVKSTSDLLKAGATALDAVVHAVSRLEDDPLFNCGRGAVFTRVGTIELEASVMVSTGYHKRGCGVTLVKKVKNPIQLAREILIRGQVDSGPPAGVGEAGHGDEGSAQGHVFLAGETCLSLAQQWGLDIVDEDYHWTKRRWEEHRRGLDREAAGLGSAVDDGFRATESDLPDWSEIATEYWGPNASWDGKEYLPQGTVGAVCLDKYGTIAVATSTGGLTNKLPGRVGDTPTLGAGFWAEEWTEPISTSKDPRPPLEHTPTLVIDALPSTLRQTLALCLPSSLATQLGIMRSEGPATLPVYRKKRPALETRRHAVALSGTGNGDSFLRLSAARTMGAIVRFSSGPSRSLQSAVSQIIGPDGEMQQSAGDKWGKTGEGEGGTIGIELKDGVSTIVADLNCGGMFRAWVDDVGEHHMRVFRDEY